jgi:4-amino-4-deoxy-L-arabinose transferase-like glycosyltransferase
MMQAFLVLPAFALVYLVAVPTAFWRRVGQVLVAGLALVVAGGWWVATVELWPASARPYIGGSTNNSILDLIWGYNGLGRIEGGTGAGPGGGAGGNFSGATGLLRLFNSQMAGQISWLVPAALVMLVAGLVWTARRPRTDRTRAALLLWGGWLVVTGLVYSEMSGIIHPYYTNTLAPAIAVLVGVGAVELWRLRTTLAARVVLATALTATVAWSYRLLQRTPSWHPELRLALILGGLAVAAAILTVPLTRRGVATAVAAVGLAAALAGPVAFTLDTVANAATGSLVSAGPASAGGFGGRGGFSGGSFGGTLAGGPGGSQSASSALVKLISESPSSYTWAVATSSSMSAAPIELATGKAVMAIGGFNGGDQAITLARFKQLVAAGKIHYYLAGGNGGGGPGGGGFGFGGGRGGSSEIASWVESTFKTVNAGGTTLYDLSTG